MTKIAILVFSLGLCSCAFNSQEQNSIKDEIEKKPSFQEENQQPQGLLPLLENENSSDNPCGYDIIQLYDGNGNKGKVIWIPLYCDPLPYIELGRPTPIMLVE